MEPITSVVDKLKGFAKSSHKFVNGLVPRRDRNPVIPIFSLQLFLFFIQCMLPLISNSPEKLAHFLNTGLDLSEERERKENELL
ncbi:hypothetical protein CK203_087852 [Vitis vinifera]|uniref:Uncharacterized protein n=1 Tax=Vitis vinifera TaxID=29760 RepID=A0A438E465_VITVI|nr:hypothetical protein CK203_087852 [Vitis vinifera]